MRTILAVWTAILLTATSAHAFEMGAESFKREPGQSAIDHYSGSSAFVLAMCSISMRSARAVAELREMGKDVTPEDLKKSDYAGCIRTGKARLKPVYEEAARSIRKPAAKAALKEHYVLTLAAIDGIRPAPDERTIDYERRRAAEQKAVTTQWTRFEVEQ